MDMTFGYWNITSLQRTDVLKKLSNEEATC